MRSYLFPACLALLFFIAMVKSFVPGPAILKSSIYTAFNEYEEWKAPDENSIPFNAEGDKIRYGKKLIVNTALFLGSNGIVSSFSNKMSCQNCHLKAGTQNYSFPLSAVASTYPKYRERNDRVESIEYRINECMKRSLNGKPLDPESEEMQAMVAYLNWLGKDVPKDVKPKGSSGDLPYLDRAADTVQGRKVFELKCQRCHQPNGEGLLSMSGNEFVYPPLWGENSFNVSAGLFRLSNMAEFIRNSMPEGATNKNPQLSVEEAWDVASFIVSQPRPVKFFPEDYRDYSKKPVDYPFGPYADTFSEQQHKYGPFGPMTKQTKSERNIRQ